MVLVPKSNGKVRICVDFTKLNENVCRELHMLPTVDETLSKLSGAKVFSKLDANSGFWKIPLAEESKHLTTFITPVGRFCFNRLPFGICSAPEYFQRLMSYILENLSGVLCNMDDVIVFGETQKQHDERLVEVLRKLAQAGVTLNKKCEFSKSSLKYLGHMVSSEGIKADPDKISAIKNMSAPTDVSGVRRLLGMVNQLAKFLPNLADMTSSHRELLVKKNSFCWSEV